MKRPLLAALAGLLVFSTLSPAFAKGNKRKARKLKPKAEVLAWQEPAFTSILEVTGGPEPDLRDAPADVPPAPVALAAPMTLVERLAAERNRGSRSVDAYTCRDGARNLRFMVSVAKNDLKDVDTESARRKFVSGLKRELDLLHRSQPPQESEVAVLATEAEMELEGALKELESRPLRPGTLAAASRAADNLDAAARLLASR
ncbi:MAG: hypothetical protein HY925_08650 [Elusimicrobia bacterium]|nr:hypothetical protein [Elusimicrobiota bacterium]